MKSAISRFRLTLLKRKAALDLLIGIEVVVTALLCVLCIWQGTSAQSELSFIEISLDGTALYIPDERKLLRDWTPNDLLQERLLKTFIQGLRGVSTENDENYNNIMRVLYRTSGQAYMTVASYFKENSPGTRNKEVTVRVPYEDIELTRYEDANTWKIVWREVTESVRTGNVVSDRQYEAVVKVMFATPADETSREWNPAGVYIYYMDSDLLRSYT